MAIAGSKAETIGKLTPLVLKREGGGLCNRYCELCQHVVGSLDGSAPLHILNRDCQGIDGEGVSDPKSGCVLAEVLLHFGAT